QNTGMAFDTAGNLYVTNFAAQTISRLDTRGRVLGTFGDSWSGVGLPESIVFDSGGSLYVGSATGGNSGTSAPIRKLDAAGNLLATYAAAHEERGTDWVDVAADQCT